MEHNDTAQSVIARDAAAAMAAADGALPVRPKIGAEEYVRLNWFFFSTTGRMRLSR